MLTNSDALKRIIILVSAINVITIYEEESISFRTVFVYT